MKHFMVLSINISEQKLDYDNKTVCGARPAAEVYPEMLRFSHMENWWVPILLNYCMYAHNVLDTSNLWSKHDK